MRTAEALELSRYDLDCDTFERLTYHAANLEAPLGAEDTDFFVWGGQLLRQPTNRPPLRDIANRLTHFPFPRSYVNGIDPFKV